MTTLPLDPYISTSGYFHDPNSPGDNAYHEPPVMRSFAAAIRTEIGSTVPAPPDLSNYFTKAESNARFEQFTNKAQASGYAPLDAAGLVPTVHIPPLAINDTFVVASEAAMLALTAQRGDMAIRTDTGRTYVLSAEPASTLANWKEVLAAGQVTSVNGKTGVVSLTATDVGAYTKAESDAKYALIGHNHDAAYLPIGTFIPPATHITSTNGSVVIVESPTGTFDLAASGGGGGSVTVLRDEEFAPAVAATTVTLAATPTDIHTVTRNGVVQSLAAGHYTVAGAVLTFSDAFVAGERVSVVYSIGTSVPVDSWTQAEADARFVNVPGDTMTGNLQINATRPILTTFDPSGTLVARFGSFTGDALYGTLNARYDGTNWFADDTSKPSAMFSIGVDGAYNFYNRAAASNPISTWTPRFSITGTGLVYLAANSGAGTGLTIDQGGIMVSHGHAINLANPPQTLSMGWATNASNQLALILNGSPTGTWFATTGDLTVKGTLTLNPGGENLSGVWLAHNTTFAHTSFMGMEGDNVTWRVYSALASPGNKLSINLDTGYVSIPGGFGVTGVITTSGGITGNGSVFNLASTANMQLSPAGTVVHPSGDNTILLGYPTLRWANVYAAAATISSIGAPGQLSLNGGFHVVITAAGGGWLYNRSTGHTFFDGSPGAIVAPEADNKLICGGTGNRWQYIAAVNGGINTCWEHEKEIVGTVDPEAALEAILATPLVLYHPKDGEGTVDRKLTFAGPVNTTVDPQLQIGDGALTAAGHQVAYAMAAIKALAAEVAELKARLAA
jgi:hypothetical protein